MIKNYFKIAWRNLIKNKASSFINIGGLAVGIAVAMSIGLWIYDELSYDKHIKNYDRIAAVMQHPEVDGGIETWSSQSFQLGSELRNKYGSNFKHVVMSTFTKSSILSFKEKTFTKSGNFMEAAAPELLSLTMLTGSQAALKDLNSILLSESVANTVFGDANPMGEVLTIDNKMAVTVAGVYKDFPDNSSFNNLAFIAPLDMYVKHQTFPVGWYNNWLEVFVQVADNVDMNVVSNAI